MLSSLLNERTIGQELKGCREKINSKSSFTEGSKRYNTWAKKARHISTYEQT